MSDVIGSEVTGSNVAGSEAAVAYAREQGGRFVEELKELLRIPSVSTAPEHVGDVRRAAEFVADGLRAAGMEHVRLIETNSATHTGHPLVYADWLHADRRRMGRRSLRCCCMGTTMCSRRSRWMSGSRLRLSRRRGMGTSMPGGSG